MTRYQNSFIRSALEELDAEVSAGGAAGGVTEVVVDNSTDAVAELMEKNVTLESSNAELEEESFDNDVSAIAGASDSTHADLDEAVDAGAALEELAVLCDLTIRGKLTNKATVASQAMMFNQITTTLKIPNQMAALEALVTSQDNKETTTEEQTKSIGAKASDIAKSIGKKLVDGIKRIIGWLIGVLRNLMASSKKIEERAEAAMKLIETIDVSKKITAGPFIASLRLVEGGGDANDQFSEYFKLADTALNGFFNNSFSTHMLSSSFKVEGTPEGVRAALGKVVQAANDTMFTEHGDASDVSVEIPEDISDQELSVTLTKPCIGGLQLFLASTHGDSKKFYCRSGVAKKELKFASPSEIPVIEKATAKLCLASAVKLLKTHKELEDTLDDIVRRSQTNWLNGSSAQSMLGDYLTTLAAFATSVAPQLLRLNMKNSGALIAYVEKSITVSKPESKAKDEKEAK